MKGRLALLLAVAIGSLLAGCAAPQAEGPSEPAPEPPAMVAEVSADRLWHWSCADGTRLDTRYVPERDELELELAGRSYVLSRRQHRPSAVWGADGVTFSMTGSGDAIVRWQNDDVDCERAAP